MFRPARMFITSLSIEEVEKQEKYESLNQSVQCFIFLRLARQFPGGELNNHTFAMDSLFLWAHHLVGVLEFRVHLLEYYF